MIKVDKHFLLVYNKHSEKGLRVKMNLLDAFCRSFQEACHSLVLVLARILEPLKEAVLRNLGHRLGRGFPWKCTLPNWRTTTVLAEVGVLGFQKAGGLAKLCQLS